MLTLTITVTGKTEGDIENGLDEAARRYNQGNLLGFDRNDSGSFRFEVTGEEEPAEDEEEGVSDDEQD